MSLPTPYYSHAGITIYHGDCRDILPHVTADVVVTDPPYGVGGSQNTMTAVNRGYKKNDYASIVDSPELVAKVVVPILTDMIGRGLRVVFTPGNKWLTLYPPPDSFGVFYQPSSVGLQPWGRADAQPILYYGRSPHAGTGLPGISCSFVSTVGAVENGHPCPKPIGIWIRLVSSVSLEGETILDPFMGSGTTLVAAKQLGRKAIGIEIEERYCEIAVKRLAQEVLPLEPAQPEPEQASLLETA